MMKILFASILALLFLAPNARADYGWMPRDQKLFLGIGGDYFGTSSNFTTNSNRTNLNFGNTAARLNAVKFWIEPEYGIAEGWAVRLRLNFVAQSMSATGTQGFNTVLPSGTALSDLLVGIKYKILTGAPSMVFETTVKIPTYSTFFDTQQQANTALLPGDGNVDLGLALHVGYTHKYLMLQASPQFLIRTGGYSSAIVLRGAAGVRFPNGFALATTRLYASMGDNLLYDSSSFVHDGAGSGGSYALLSGSPTLFTLGFKGGVRVTPRTFLEANFEQAVWGIRAPFFFQAGLNVVFTFDFYKTDTRTHIKEIPFDSDPESNPDGTTSTPVD